MNELLIISQTPATIKFDKQKALTEAQAIMQKYDGLEFQEEDLKDAKKELATLRKVSKEVNNQALEIDRQLTQEVKQFRDDVKEVISVITKVINNIDNQVKTFENKQKDVRKQQIIDMEEYKNISDYIPFNDEWLLKKYDDKTLKELFTSHKEQIDMYVGTIKMTCSTLGLESDFYIEKLKTTPYAQVIELINTVSQATTKEEVKPVVIDETEQLLTITRTITGTRTQLMALKKYALEIGCKYE